MFFVFESRVPQEDGTEKTYQAFVNARRLIIEDGVGMKFENDDEDGDITSRGTINGGKYVTGIRWNPRDKGEQWLMEFYAKEDENDRLREAT